MALRIAFFSGMRLSEIRRAEPRGPPGCWPTRRTATLASCRFTRAPPCARNFEPKAPKITIQRNWERAREKAGLHGMHFHDWRHSAASELINAGVDLFTVGRVLGHKDARSTARYSHLAIDAVGKMGQKNPATSERRRA